MNISDIPSKILKAFGVNGPKNTIPVDSSTTTDSNGVATFDKGFPPITMQPLSAGGKPPTGQDMNGILNAITVQQQWQNAGGSFPFDSSFAGALSGYPAGAVIPSSDFYGFWQNTADGNSTNPESVTGALTGWVPRSFYGSSAVSVTTANVTVPSLAAARDEIVITGNLTGNRYLYLPAWSKSWRIANNCTGNFSVLISTQGGSAIVSSRPGMTVNVRCDGTGIYPVQQSNFASPGYLQMDNGILLQWGSVGVDPGASIIFDYPKPFSVSAFMGVACKGSEITTSDYSCGIDTYRTQAKITNGNNVSGSTGTQGIKWFVIGV